MHDDDETCGWRPRYQHVAELRRKGAKHTIPLDAYLVDEPELGIWCDSCALPSIVRVRMLLAVATTLDVRGTATIEHCYECDDQTMHTF